MQPSKLGKMAGGKKLSSYMYYLTAVRQQIFERVFFVVSIIKSRKQMLKCFLQMTLRACDIFFFSKKMIKYLKMEIV